MFKIFITTILENIISILENILMVPENIIITKLKQSLDKEKLRKLQEQMNKASVELLNKLTQKEYTLEHKSTRNGYLLDNNDSRCELTTQQIKETIFQQISIDEKMIIGLTPILYKPIKEIGLYDITVKLNGNLATIKLWVIPSETDRVSNNLATSKLPTIISTINPGRSF